MSINQSLTLNFQNASSSSFYKMETDTEYNTLVYGESKSNFEPGDDVYLKLFPGENVETYTLYTSEGSLSVATKNILYEVEDQITFAHSKQGSFSYNPDSIISYEWLGEDGGVPVFAGQNITIPSEKTAVLKIIYKTKGDRLKLSNVSDLGADFTVVCASVFSSGGIASQTITFQGVDPDDPDDPGLDPDDPESLLTDVTLTVKDVITGNPIPFANVIVSGVGSGSTNENGQITFSNLQKGQTYDVVTRATGYQDSNTDYLNNDSFTIPMD